MPSRRTKRKSIANREKAKDISGKNGRGGTRKGDQGIGTGVGATGLPVGNGKDVNISSDAYSTRFPSKAIDVEMEREPVPKVPNVERAAEGPTNEGFKTNIATRRGLDKVVNIKADSDDQPSTSNLQVLVDSSYKEKIQQLSHSRALLEKDEMGPELLIRANYPTTTLTQLENLADAVIEATLSEPTTVTFNKHLAYEKLPLPNTNLEYLVSEDRAFIIVREELPHITVDMNVELGIQIKAVATQLIDKSLLNPCVWAPAMEGEIHFETSGVLVAREGANIDEIIKIERARRRATGDSMDIVGDEYIKYKTAPHILSETDGSSRTIRIDGLIRNDLHNGVMDQWKPGIRRVAELQAMLLTKVPAGYVFPNLTPQMQKWFYTYHDDHSVSVGALFDALPEECSEYYRNVYLQALSGLRMISNNVLPLARTFSAKAGINMNATTAGSLLTSALTEKQDVLVILQTLMMCSAFNNYRITFPEPRSTTVVEAVAACVVLLTFSTQSIDAETHRVLLGHIHSFVVGSVNRLTRVAQMIHDLEDRRWPIIYPRAPFEFVAEGISPMLDDNRATMMNAIFNLDPANARLAVEDLVLEVQRIRYADFDETVRFKSALSQYLTQYCYAMADASLSMHRFAVDFRLSVPNELRDRFKADHSPVMISPKKILSFTAQLSELMYDSTTTQDLTEFANARNDEFLELDKDIQQALSLIKSADLVNETVRTGATKKLIAVERFINKNMPQVSKAMSQILTLVAHSDDIKSGYKALISVLSGIGGPHLNEELLRNPINRINEHIVNNVMENLEAYGITRQVLVCRRDKAARLPAGLFETDINGLLYKSPFLVTIPTGIDNLPLQRLTYPDCLLRGFAVLAKDGAFILDTRCNFEYEIMTEDSAVTSHDHKIVSESQGFKITELRWSIGMASMHPDDNRDNISMMNSNFFAFIVKPQNLMPWNDILRLEAVTEHMPKEIVPYGKALTATLIT
ncbi:VP2 [Callinectes sapidus reovirus 2]|uniref:VP2 n=1 Tax=Callinectes sapidus reovirus 2 TaxID=2789658 RepID=A0A7U3SUW0_9REOV|nr:VP2 [Callinectes sapidus reovirus 2]